MGYMKQFIPKELPENIYALTDADINLIHAMACYFTSVPRDHTGMTEKAYELVQKLEEQTRMHEIALNVCEN